jgi:hypothetical protein
MHTEPMQTGRTGGNQRQADGFSARRSDQEYHNNGPGRAGGESHVLQKNFGHGDVSARPAGGR